MPRSFRERAVDTGRARSRFVRQRLADELRIARVASGMTQSQLASAAGLTQAFVSGVERAVRTPSIDAACRLAAAVGHELSIRLFPASGVPLRDSGQLEIANAIAASAHRSWHPHLELPVASNDRRAADLVLVGPDEVLHLEIERQIVDLQAQLRAAKLKRDALASRFVEPVRLVIVLPERRSSRDVVAKLGPLVERTMPARSAAVRRAILNGLPLGTDGILFWPISRRRARE
jgi:transcriptional regulator with XRE-family HTH domain